MFVQYTLRAYHAIAQEVVPLFLAVLDTLALILCFEGCDPKVGVVAHVDFFHMIDIVIAKLFQRSHDR